MEPLPWYRVFVPMGLVVILTIMAIVRREFLLRSIVCGIWVMVVYAVIQDQFSARLCPEYFTIFHNPIPGLTDPTLVGLSWGFLASWWGGAMMGCSAGLTASLGPKRPLPLSTLMIGMVGVMVLTGVVTALTGWATYQHVESFRPTFDPGMMQGVAPENERYVFIVAIYHLVAYAVAILGSIGFCLVLAIYRHYRHQ